MALNRLRRDGQLDRDVAVARTGRDERGDLVFPGTQPAESLHGREGRIGPRRPRAELAKASAGELDDDGGRAPTSRRSGSLVGSSPARRLREPLPAGSPGGLGR